MSYTFLFNVSADNAESTIVELCRGWVGREIVIGNPQATSQHTVEELLVCHMVGLYRTLNGTSYNPTYSNVFKI